MKKSELPLYLKISPIYNKILQLLIAVICFVFVLGAMVQSQSEHNAVISEHFSRVSEEQLQQAVTGLKTLLAINNNQAMIKDYIEKLSDSEIIHDVHYYDHTGLLLASSNNAQSIKALMGINTDNLAENNTLEDNKAEFFLQAKKTTYIPFVKEIRDENLIGYLRFTVDEKMVIRPLLSSSFDVHETMRLLFLFAVLIGFFLTRGFSRFSRQGFRILNK